MNIRAKRSLPDFKTIQIADHATPAPILAPMPRNLELMTGAFRLDRPIHLATVGCPSSLIETLETLPRWSSRITRGPACPTNSARVNFSLTPSEHLAPQSFSLKISPIHIEAFGGDEAGLFYAATTLRQLVRQYRRHGSIPCLFIHDAPDFPVRGYMLDIRNRIPNMDALFRWVDQLAEFRINQLQLCAERFSGDDDPCAQQDLLPLTADDFHRLDLYCRRNFIELVPHQRSLDQNILKDLHRFAEQRNRMLYIWEDAWRQHPERIPQLPKNITVLDRHDDSGEKDSSRGMRLAEAGIRQFICPGTSTWNSIAGRWDNARANLKAAAEWGKRSGAGGYLITDWGENGHWQHPCFSLPPIVFGAAIAWCLASNRNLDVAQAINAHIARLSDKGSLGEILLILGNLYNVCTPVPVNGSTLFSILFHHEQPIMAPSARLAGATRENLQCAKAQLDELDVPVVSSPNPAILPMVAEIENARAMLNHAACLGLARLDYHGAAPDELPEFLRAFARDELKTLITEFEHVWLRTSRHGGLRKSVRPLHRLLNAYWPRRDRLPMLCLAQRESCM